MDDPMTPAPTSKIAVSLTDTLTRISADLETEQTLKEVRSISPLVRCARAKRVSFLRTVDQGITATARYVIPCRHSADQPRALNASRST